MAISHCSAIVNALTAHLHSGYSGGKWQKVGQSGAMTSPADAFDGGKKRAEMSAHFRPPGRCRWRWAAENAGRARMAMATPAGGPFFAASRTCRSTPKAAYRFLHDLATCCS